MSESQTRESDLWDVLDVAHKWETLGLLTPVQRDERGVNLGRRVTDTLLNPVQAANQVNA